MNYKRLFLPTLRSCLDYPLGTENNLRNLRMLTVMGTAPQKLIFESRQSVTSPD